MTVCKGTHGKPLVLLLHQSRVYSSKSLMVYSCSISVGGFKVFLKHIPLENLQKNSIHV